MLGAFRVSRDKALHCSRAPLRRAVQGLGGKLLLPLGEHAFTAGDAIFPVIPDPTFCESKGTQTRKKVVVSLSGGPHSTVWLSALCARACIKVAHVRPALRTGGQMLVRAPRAVRLR